MSALTNLDGISVHLDVPDVLEDGVHGSAVVELLLELDALPRHLDADEDVQQGARQVTNKRMLVKQSLPVIAAKYVCPRSILDSRILSTRRDV